MKSVLTKTLGFLVANPNQYAEDDFDRSVEKYDLDEAFVKFAQEEASVIGKSRIDLGTDWQSFVDLFKHATGEHYMFYCLPYNDAIEALKKMIAVAKD